MGIVFALLSAAIQGVIAQVVFSVLSSFVNAFLGLVVTGSFMSFYLNATGNQANTSGA